MSEMNGTDAAQQVTIAKPSEAVLRRMDHRQWLKQFSYTMNTRPQGIAPPMTPFAAGVVARTSLAADYIELLEAEIDILTKENERLKSRLAEEARDAEDTGR